MLLTSDSSLRLERQPGLENSKISCAGDGTNRAENGVVPSGLLSRERETVAPGGTESKATSIVAGVAAAV